MRLSQKAFTLVEVLIALVILSAGIMLLVQSWSGSLLMIQKTKINVEIAALLERKMAEIEMEYQGKSLESIPEEKEDNFGSEFPKYTWKMESREFELPDLSAVLTAQGDANVDLIQIMKLFSEHLGKSIKEVKVTVFYSGYKKPIQAAVTTFFVDYDKQLPFPGGGGSNTSTNSGTTGGNTQNGNTPAGGSGGGGR